MYNGFGLLVAWVVLSLLVAYVLYVRSLKLEKEYEEWARSARARYDHLNRDVVFYCELCSETHEMKWKEITQAHEPCPKCGIPMVMLGEHQPDFMDWYCSN